MFGTTIRETFTDVANVVNKKVANNQKEEARSRLSMVIAVVVVYIILMVLVGPWLWNNVLKRLVPAVGKAKWYDIILLAILVGLVAP